MCNNSLSSHATSLLVASSWLLIGLLASQTFTIKFHFIKRVISCNGAKETRLIRSLILIMRLHLSGI